MRGILGFGKSRVDGAATAERRLNSKDNLHDQTSCRAVAGIALLKAKRVGSPSHKVPETAPTTTTTTTTGSQQNVCKRWKAALEAASCPPKGQVAA
ncbi:uncharacterized protein UV8b_03435 [Ustilaginoidea virens]|uniref:Uncharacterized protein n=1 Tax=Ustilaginoidea virens TaxID=1159556 RepID=A0A8E5HPL0_USTVR|nr:uncharacterized protein UV8b_03435 [Ustilaginoidea virens]QUC19194.1 hypothetical protein UV8b_03435 [Ustilaginoidea virens]